jgi:dihydrofolate synthase/folylpolyglutamate synthase
MSLARVLGELYARVPLGMRLGLDAMNAACDAAGHPERAFACVHVAGTNGKGSVCAMVESIARAAGKKTGLYTSPHLVKLAERIRVNGEPLSDDVLEIVLARALAIGPELSFFETVTLAAFFAFRDAGVDLAVIEVGIGGRLDATNVIPPPRVAAVTRIALDHMDKLGDTLGAIAREKAAIAKAGVPVVVGEMEPSVRAAIDEVAHAAGATTVDAAGSDEMRLSASLGASPLLGAHQAGNRAVAYRIARTLGLEDDAIVRGLRATRWPGRLEQIDSPSGTYFLDGAHNPDGAAALAAYLRTHAHAGEIAIVFGALADKSWPEMLDVLAPVADRRVYVEPRGRAAAPPSELAERLPGATARSLSEALAAARAGVGRHGTVVICGSLYLVGEARALLLGLESDPPVAM